MQTIEKIKYTRPYLFNDEYFFDGINQKIYLEKSFNKSNSSDQYFLKLYLHMPSGNFICQGYIYFYLEQKESKFIGVYIKPEYRNRGLASLLVSTWIKFCLDNDICILSTNKNQRKPFLLYLLKLYSFELEDINMYNIFLSTIDICQDENNNSKYLFFRNPNQKSDFLRSAIMKEDNYVVLDELRNGINVVDNVILSKPYHSQDNEFAYKKALEITTKKVRI